MELVVSGVARGCTRGETYFVPAGTPHAARIEAGYADVSVFDEPGRYAPRPRPGAPVEVCGIDHVVLTVRDVAATCDFYRRALGMRVVEFDGRRALAFGGQKINLHEAGGGPEPKAAAPTPGSADLCLVTSTPVPEILGHLEREGIPVVEGPVRRSGALGPMTSVYLRDPDGNLVEVSRYEA
ncbi:hypothetical protein G3N55_07110 [Dissulfurirhabdus thermomarina]|uniref:VOC domain-containing protein n=2 Tax=Dissulfurirhabdus thermomarina TaxID=1765737 RepID=A0A6N9TMU3_DISTH|nr:hypothetical protein [Dissulfurirhabdus thermomarina]